VAENQDEEADEDGQKEGPSIRRQMTPGASQREDDMLVCPVVAVYKITNDGLM